MQPLLTKKFTFEKFNTFTKDLTNYDELDLMSQHLTEDICKAFNIKACSIMLFDDHENQMFRIGSFGLSDAYLTKGPVLVDETCLSFKNGEPVLITDLKMDKRVQYPDAAHKEDISSMMTIPIKTRHFTTGEIRMYHHQQIEFHPDDVEFFCLLGRFLGLIIDNKGLRNFCDTVQTSIQALPKRIFRETD